MSSLLQTLFCASGRTETVDDISGEAAYGTTPNSTAGTHDSSDTTYDGLDATGDLLGPHQTLRVEYVLDNASASGQIDFVRVKHRAKRTQGSGTPTGKSRPSINGTERGVNNTLGGSYVNYQDDFTVDPDDSAAWTLAKINAKKFGVFLEGQGTLATDQYDIRVPEITVEVWGTTATTVTGGQTVAASSVQAGAANPGPLTNPGSSVQVLATAQPGGVLPGAATIVGNQLLLSMSVVSPELADTIPDSYDPEQTTVQSVVLRATTPSSLGDADTNTGVQETAADSGPGTISIQADAMANLPEALIGSISHVIFHAFGRHPRFVPPLGEVAATAQRFKWTVGANTAQWQRSGDFIESLESPSAHVYSEFISDPITTQPNGSAWDRAAIDGLVNVRVESDYPALGGLESHRIILSELWVEVFGPIGTQQQTIALRLPIKPALRIQSKLTGSI